MVTPHFVKILQRNKHIFETELRDLEWRLDQESKVCQLVMNNYIVSFTTSVVFCCRAGFWLCLYRCLSSAARL